MAVTIAVTAIVIVLLIRELPGAHRFLDAVRSANPAWVALSFALGCVAMLLAAARWQVALSAMGYRLGFRRLFVVILATWPPILVVPGRANEFLRAAGVKETVPLPVGTASVLIEKVFDLITLLVAACIGALVISMWALAGALLGAIVAVVLGLIALWKTPDFIGSLRVMRRHEQKLERLRVAFQSMRQSPAKLAGLCASSFAIRAVGIGVFYALLTSVGSAVELGEMLALWPLAVLVGLLPVTMAGMGTRDAAFIYLLTLRHYGVGEAGLLAATMGYSLITVWSFAVIGLPFMVRELTRSRAS
jgi:hypothetical protein